MLSRDQFLRREKDYWVNQTSTGKIVSFGLLVAVTVAAVVVYQVSRTTSGATSTSTRR